MNSWTLLRRLVVLWNTADNPVFLRETHQPPFWYTLIVRFSRSSGLLLMLGGMGCYLSVLLVFFLNNILVLLTPLWLLWTLVVGLTLAPVVVEERERKTWETLRMTPFDTETIVLGKAGGALWWLRDIIHLMSGMLLLVAVGIGLVSLMIAPGLIGDTQHDVVGGALCLLALVLPAVGAAVFVFDRAQQFVLIAVAALAAGSSTATVRMAMAWSSVATLLIWLADTALGLTVLALNARLASSGVTDLLLIATLGPMVGYLSTLSVFHVALSIGGTLLLREVAVRILWWLTLRLSTDL